MKMSGKGETLESTRVSAFFDGSCDSLGALARARSYQRRRGRLVILLAQLDEPEQDFVALGLQLGDRARANLGVNAVDEGLLYFWRQYRLPENLPPGRHGAGELLKEVLDAAWAAAEMIEHHVAHDAPSQARAPA